MRLGLDQGLPFRAAAVLRRDGIDTAHASEVGLSRASDDDILEWCRKEERILVTLDRDFHQIIALASASLPSVIRLRLQGLGADETAELIRIVITDHADDLTAGALITVRGHSLSVRRLPIVPMDDER